LPSDVASPALFRSQNHPKPKTNELETGSAKGGLGIFTISRWKVVGQDKREIVVSILHFRYAYRLDVIALEGCQRHDVYGRKACCMASSHRESQS